MTRPTFRARRPDHVGVIGSGPNGLAVAIEMSRAGFSTEVREAQLIPGGACRSLSLTLPGFKHDFGSAVHPLAAASPFFRKLGLEQHGLKWLHHQKPLAHPLKDGSVVTLEQSLKDTVDDLGVDGPAWYRLFSPVVEHWNDILPELLSPIIHLPRHPWRTARLAILATQPAHFLALNTFRTERARALFAGLAAHSFLPLNAPFSAAIALILGAAAHVTGWPIPQGGSSAITQALIGALEQQHGVLRTSLPVRSVSEFDETTLVFADTRPQAFAMLAGDRLPVRYKQKLQHFRPGPGVYKIDYALSSPIPWLANVCKQASTIHLGGTLDEISRAEKMTHSNIMPDQPYVIVSQPTLADPTRAPQDKHIAWAYCHVPFGYSELATSQIEQQIERYAPGFNDCVVARSVSSPKELSAMNENLIGGDISGGAMNFAQLLFRPTVKTYRTPDPFLYLCSSSTPPGAGVHGMCGYHAAQAALHLL